MKRLSDFQSEVPMKTTVALVFALVILLPHSANAETLTIRGGSIFLDQEVGPGDFSVVRFGGDDFSVEQMKEFAGIFGPAFGGDPGDISRRMRSSRRPSPPPKNTEARFCALHR